MTENEIQEQDEGLELAKRMAEEEEGIGRRPEGYSKYVIPFVASSGVFFNCPSPAG